MPTTLDYMELESAMYFVSDNSMAEHEARISRASGDIFWRSDLIDEEEEPLPDDIDNDDRYVDVPNQLDLDLGKRLALTFTAMEMSDYQGEVRRIFSSKSAYARFKDLLARIEKLDDWHRYERAAVCTALCAWAREEGFEVLNQPSDVEAAEHCEPNC